MYRCRMRSAIRVTIPAMTTIHLRLIYQGGPPVHWTGGPADFGLQDKANGLLPGYADADGTVFDFTADCKTGKNGRPALHGRFAHGPAADRFVYLSWRNADGAYAQRFKVPLAPITASQIETAAQNGARLTARLIIHEQRATSTGANIGGTRPVDWM